MTRQAISASSHLLDEAAVIAAWEDGLHAPAWTQPPCWLQGDLAPDNLLVNNGSLCAVIDWGGLATGDPATELLPAWNLFKPGSRETFHEALQLPEKDSLWRRGRALALSIALVELPYYADKIPARVDKALGTIESILMDHQGS